MMAQTSEPVGQAEQQQAQAMTVERLAKMLESFRECERLYDDTNDYGKMNYGGVGFRRAKAIIPALLADNDRLHAALAASEAREAALLVVARAVADGHVIFTPEGEWGISVPPARAPQVRAAWLIEQARALLASAALSAAGEAVER